MIKLVLCSKSQKMLKFKYKKPFVQKLSSISNVQLSSISSVLVISDVEKAILVLVLGINFSY